MGFARTDTSLIARWWTTLDRGLLAALLALITTGLFLSIAATPAIAEKRGLAAGYYVERHALFAALACVVLLGTSLLTRTQTLILAAAVFITSLAAMAALPWIGVDVKGAQRWLRLGSFTLQPSEFIKPAFIVLTAWALALGWSARAQTQDARQTVSRAAGVSLAALVIITAMLAAQPDIGQAILLALGWGVLMVISAQPRRFLVICAGLAGGALAAAYLTFAHVRSRIDAFIAPSGHEGYQLKRAAQAFGEGGWFGRGLGEGTVKTVLPDAHTDFVFAVLAEEYGVIACLALVALYGFVVFRVLARPRWGARDEPAALAARLAVLGLGTLFAAQAIINIAVNIALLPAKGMTLPFISAGGSSMTALAWTMGMVLSLKRPVRAPARRTSKAAATASWRTDVAGGARGVSGGGVGDGGSSPTALEPRGR